MVSFARADIFLAADFFPMSDEKGASQHESPSALEYMDIFHAATPSLDGMGPDAYGSLEIETSAKPSF